MKCLTHLTASKGSVFVTFCRWFVFWSEDIFYIQDSLSTLIRNDQLMCCIDKCLEMPNNCIVKVIWIEYEGKVLVLIFVTLSLHRIIPSKRINPSIGFIWLKNYIIHMFLTQGDFCLWFQKFGLLYVTEFISVVCVCVCHQQMLRNRVPPCKTTINPQLSIAQAAAVGGAVQFQTLKARPTVMQLWSKTLNNHMTGCVHIPQ